MPASLSILCITKDEPHFRERGFFDHLFATAGRLKAELVVAYDQRTVDNSVLFDIVRRLSSKDVTFQTTGLLMEDTGKGYLEEIHDDCVDHCTGDYILRLDDDERCSPAMIAWLADHNYESHDHWKFPRAHLWGDTETVLLTPQLWPDHQTRLSTKAKAGGRNHIHAGSPHGGGELAPCVIEHHKFLVKTLEERRAIADRYDRIQKGAGRTGGMTAFQVPEEAYRGQLVLVTGLGRGLAELIGQDGSGRSVQL